jgi:hypothetical protein
MSTDKNGSYGTIGGGGDSNSGRNGEKRKTTLVWVRKAGGTGEEGGGANNPNGIGTDRPNNSGICKSIHLLEPSVSSPIPLSNFLKYLQNF